MQPGLRFAQCLAATRFQLPQNPARLHKKEKEAPILNSRCCDSFPQAAEMYGYVLELSPSEDRQRHQRKGNWPFKLCASADRSTNFLMQPSTNRKEKESHALSTKKRDKHTVGLKSALRRGG